ncbi:MAG: hypothetical protein JO146_07605 [Candidatus Eremiobacteraeota bacterium]|nr:hypothetical protein [Candidatus Eremiobacteraeota bacterium]
MLVLRAVLAVALIVCGVVILVRMLSMLAAGFALVPGVVLAGAMIALGVHRISLILRARRAA